MNRLVFLTHLAALLLAPVAALNAADAPAKPDGGKPNVIVILVDDMGWTDLVCYGSEIPTPNLDALAKGGLKFTQFYNTGRCRPKRAALLTGFFPHQAGVGHMTDKKDVPAYQGHLNDLCVTIAEVLKPAGYFTVMSGKWHVGQDLGVTPWDRGFERSLNAAAGGFYFPEAPRAELFLIGEIIANDDARLPKGWYSTDLWTTFGLKFIDEALVEKKPFYLHLCHNAPHFPLQAQAEEIAKFRGKYKAGWGAIRDARYAKQLELGIIDKAWAKLGLVFDNACAPTSKCAPCRAAMLTGRNPWQLEEAGNHQPFFPAKFMAFSEALAKAGVHCGAGGKTWGPGEAKTAEGSTRNFALGGSAAKGGPGGGLTAFLQKHPQVTLFFYWFGSHNPHRAYPINSGIAAGKKPSDINHVPAYWPDNETVRHDMLDYALKVEAFDAEVGTLPAALEASGEQRRTLVSVTSDHGMPFPRVLGNGDVFDQYLSPQSKARPNGKAPNETRPNN